MRVRLHLSARGRRSARDRRPVLRRIGRDGLRGLRADDPGHGGQVGVFFMRFNGDTGDKAAPKLIDPTDRNTARGHQFWADVSADGGVLHFIWYDSRNDQCYSPTRPVGNCADLSVVPSLDVYASRSADHGDTISPSTRITDSS